MNKCQEIDVDIGTGSVVNVGDLIAEDIVEHLMMRWVMCHLVVGVLRETMNVNIGIARRVRLVADEIAIDGRRRERSIINVLLYNINYIQRLAYFRHVEIK